MRFSIIQQSVFLGLLIATTFIFLVMIGKYLLPLFWAIVFAIIFFPLYQRFAKLFRGRSSLASLTTILAIVLIVVVPTVLVGSLVVQESVGVYKSLTNGNHLENSQNLVNQASELLSGLEIFGVSPDAIEERLRSGVVNVSQALASSFITFGQITFSLIVYTVITLYLLFFLLRDGVLIKNKLKRYLPLGEEKEDRLFARFAGTTRAVVKGTFTIAVIQGAIGGLVFFIAGVSAPVLWGVVMGILSIIPAVGPFLVWGPVGVILIATGSIWQGVMILATGALLVSLVDEFLRPILVGRNAQIPDPIILLATIGGITSFGISGLVVGPIIAAFFLSLWAMFEEKYHKQLSKS